MFGKDFDNSFFRDLFVLGFASRLRFGIDGGLQPS